MIDWLTSRVGAALSAIVAVLALLGGVYFVGKRDQRQADKARTAEYLKRTMEVDREVAADSPDARRERLLRNAKR